MSKESIAEALPWDVRYTKFQEDGTWFVIMADGQRFFAKIPNDHVAKYLAGEVVPAYHPLTTNLEKPAYLPGLLGTVEPWYVCSARVVAPVHPVQAAALDQAMKDAIAGKGTPEEEPKSEIVKPGPRKLILP